MDEDMKRVVPQDNGWIEVVDNDGDPIYYKTCDVRSMKITHDAVLIYLPGMTIELIHDNNVHFIAKVITATIQNN